MSIIHEDLCLSLPILLENIDNANFINICLKYDHWPPFLFVCFGYFAPDSSNCFLMISWAAWPLVGWVKWEPMNFLFWGATVSCTSLFSGYSASIDFDNFKSSASLSQPSLHCFAHFSIASFWCEVSNMCTLCRIFHFFLDAFQHWWKVRIGLSLDFEGFRVWGFDLFLRSDMFKDVFDRFPEDGFVLIVFHIFSYQTKDN